MINHSGNCIGERCFECNLKNTLNPQEYQDILTKLEELKIARDKFAKLEQELTNGF